MNTLNNDLKNILQGVNKPTLTREISYSLHHNWAGTIHIFLAAMEIIRLRITDLRQKCGMNFDIETVKAKIFASGQSGSVDTLDDEARLRYYEEFKEEIDGILSSEGLSVNAFTIYAANNFPQDAMMSTLDVIEMEEYKDIQSELINRAVTQCRTQGLEDLIYVLFQKQEGTLANAIINLTSTMDDPDEVIESLYDNMSEIAGAVGNNPEAQLKHKALDGMPGVINLNKYTMDHKCEFIGCESFADQLEIALTGMDNKNALLTGKAGVGKTTIVQEVARRLATQTNISAKLNGYTIYEFDATTLIAIFRSRGEMGFTSFFEQVGEIGNAIIFIDEAHIIAPALSLLKPQMSKGTTQFILSTTQEDSVKMSEDKAFLRRLNHIVVTEPTKDVTMAILKTKKDRLENHFKMTIEDEALSDVIDYANKFIVNYANPAKSFKLLDSVCSTAFVDGKKSIELIDILKTISHKYSINIAKNKIGILKKALKEEILGQDAAINDVIKNLRYIDMGMIEEDKTLGVFMLAGPTGVGKTRMAELIAEYYFGNKDAIIKLNMGEYSDGMGVAKLTGSAAGYVGSDKESALITKIKERPSSVVLFDEIEKADDDVLDVLLNILDKGTMDDNHNNTVSFKNAVIIFTSNAGFNDGNTGRRSIGVSKQTADDHEMLTVRKAIEDQIGKAEFINRIDDMIIFRRITDAVVDELIEKYAKHFIAISKNKAEIYDYEKFICDVKKDIDTRKYGVRDLKKGVKAALLKQQKFEDDEE